MKRFISIAVLFGLLLVLGGCDEGTPTDAPRPDWYVEPCPDYRCDSLAVRAILDSNGLDTLAVEDAPVDAAAGRITSLGGIWDRIDWAVLPPEIGSLVALTRLTIVSRDFESLPPEIGNLVALEDLFIGGTNLTSLPPEIGNLVALKQLYLEDNNLASLPSEIGNLTSLYTLNLQVNDLTSLPSEIGQLTSLETLELRRNRLTSLPESVTSLTGVQYVGVCHNHLANLTTKVTAWLDQYAGSDWRDCQGVGQAYTDDSLAVRAVLDSNGLDSVAVEDITEILGCRVERLEMDQLGLTVVPPQITSLAPSELFVCGNHLTNVTPEVAAWLDQYADAYPDWRDCQTPAP